MENNGHNINYSMMFDLSDTLAELNELYREANYYSQEIQIFGSYLENVFQHLPSQIMRESESEINTIFQYMLQCLHVHTNLTRRTLTLEQQVDAIQVQYNNHLCRNCLFRDYAYYVDNISVSDSEASDDENNDEHISFEAT